MTALLKTDNKISKCVRLGESGNNATKRSNSPLSTNVGPRRTQQARVGPIPSFANFGTHGNRPSCLVPASCSSGVPVGNVPDQNFCHLECSRRNNSYVQTCTEGGQDTPSPRPVGTGQWGKPSPANALEVATTALAGRPVPSAGGAAPMGDAVPHRCSPAAITSLVGQPVPPAGLRLWGLGSRTGALQAAATAWAGHRVPLTPGAVPMGDAVPRRRSPSSDQRPNQWGRTCGGCGPPHALRMQRPSPGQDTLSPQPEGPRLQGMLSPVRTLQAATTAWMGHPITCPQGGGAAPMGDAVPRRRSPGSDHRLGGAPPPRSWWGRANGAMPSPASAPQALTTA